MRDVEKCEKKRGSRDEKEETGSEGKGKDPDT